MLRVGLTGSLGSGKSTVAAMLRKLGAQIVEADALGRAMMEPGEPVYRQIVDRFGPQVVSADGRLDRARLAEIAFREGRLQDLNAIVHPAVIAAQRRWMDELFARDPAAVAVVESALIFEVMRDARARGEEESVLAGVPGDRSSSPGWLAGVPGDRSSSPGYLANWRSRIDRIIVVIAPDELKIERYAARVSPSPEGRAAAAADARLRLAHQIPDAEKASQADFVLDNSGDLLSLGAQVAALWEQLKTESNNFSAVRSLQ